MSGPHVIIGDAGNIPMPAESVDCVVTSPPYFGLRRYGDSHLESGKENLEKYIEDERRKAADVMRVLKPTGTFWYNVKDTAANSGGAGGDHTKGSKKKIAKYKQGDMGLVGNQWGLVPERLRLAFQEDGWRVRAVIIWDQGVLHPESLDHARRPGFQYETITMFTKSGDYYFDASALPDEDRGNVWRFAFSRGKDHQAPFPDELPKRCIAVSTRPGDVVLDPHGGTATTARVAAMMDRHGYAVELYPEIAIDAASREIPFDLT
jgi:site-specific DNA-methyltransferase (cytosine-N4-specific)